MKDRIRAREAPSPRLHLLGPVEVTDTYGVLAGGRTPHELHEVLAAIHLHPGITTTVLARMIGRPARDVMSLVSRTRRWLGQAPGHDEPILTGRGTYRLHGLTCDWSAFHRLTVDPADDAKLTAALELVRDRPLADIAAGRWPWADEWLEQAIDAIVDTAHTVATQAVVGGDVDRARWAIRRGRTADPYTEVLGRDELRVAYTARDVRRFHHITARIVETARSFGVELDPETRQLLARIDAVGGGEENRRPVTMERQLSRTA